MHLNKLPLLIFAVISLALPSILQAHKNHDTSINPFVVTGVVKNTNNSTLLEDFSNYLSQHSGYPLKVIFASNYTDLSQKMRNNPLAIGWTCGAPYVQDHNMYNQQLIAVPTFNHQPTYYSIVLTRSDRNEKTLADFKNGILSYSDPRSNSGFLSPKHALYKQGIDINTHFRLLLNAGNHEGSIEALLNGLSDVAAVDEYIWLAYLKDNPNAKNTLREIERMGPYPFTPIVASSGVTKQNIRKLTAALVNMKNDNKGRNLLKKLYLDGFVRKTHEFYNPIESMLKDVDISTGD